MSRPIRARIDSAALAHNHARVRAAAPASRVMAIVKADGYGHGLLRVAAALPEADAFGVACLEEAVRLREAGVEAAIVLLEGFFSSDELESIAALDIEVVVHQIEQIEMLERSCLSRPLRVWLKVNSGMHRLGFRPEATVAAWRRLRDCARVAPVPRLMTHLACADERGNTFTRQQLGVFRAAVAGLPGEHSIANSAGLLAWPEARGDWVRPGIMLYGISPFPGEQGLDAGLQPVMTLETRLIAVNHCRRGDAIGYGGTWVCPEDMPVGVAAAGYGDGYPRHAPAGTPVLVNGAPAALVGRVSMDMITLDLRAQPGARPGDPVVLWGRGLPVEEIAARAGTIAYELVCGVTPRVPKEVVEGAGPVRPD